MGPAQSDHNAFDSDDLDHIEMAFNDIWSAVIADYPFRAVENDEELKGIIRNKLFALAKGGVVNPEVLAALAFQTAPLKALRNGGG